MVQLRHEFPVVDNCLYFNHAAVAPWPRRTAEAVYRFAQENLHYGASHYPDWLNTERTLRQQLKTLINAPTIRSIALAKSTSEALSMIANGLKWAPGDEVVITDQEFPSNRIVWEALSSRGVRVREAELTPAGNPEEAILNEVGPRTRLVSVSSVQYANGLRLDIARIGAALRDHPALFCVDAIQSLGAQVFDAQACEADFVVADGHKWMLGPEGLALMYVKPEWLEILEPSEFGWHMVHQRGDYTRRDWTPATDATRFECGSPNMLGIHALSASLSLLLEVGMETVQRTLEARIDQLYQALANTPGIRLLSPEQPERRAGMVTFDIPSHDLAEVYRKLSKSGVVCALRGGGIRLSPHFYTPAEQIGNVVSRIKASMT
ncbi:aminotransferase class V-fold PLP-dependent enzyme [Hahella sp. SMD15-11]|uniref:Aminotransferase class V-fold PLP-dependent enzyme n=1 Tax=Thermohahella caldifontis TaxID=3142973 RepID=A0AB39UYQ2_9GAMM